MATTDHTKHTELLYHPKATRESVSLRLGGVTLNSYKVGDRSHIVLTFPQLKALSLLYEAFIDAMDQGKQSEADRELHFNDLGTTKVLIRRLMTLNLICATTGPRFAITMYGADEYEFQWYVAESMKHNSLVAFPTDDVEDKPDKKPDRFTDKEVRNIRSSKDNLADLAELYECSINTISRIRTFTTYKDVT